MNQRVLVSSSNTGIGLWTTICFAFCAILGRQSKNYKKKQDKVLRVANDGLLIQLNELDGNYHLVDYRVTWSDKLSVTVSAIAQEGGEVVSSSKSPSKATGGKETKPEKPHLCPKCGAEIEDDMMFCGECGEKLK